jgi:hypothetical protein
LLISGQASKDDGACIQRNEVKTIHGGEEVMRLARTLECHNSVDSLNYCMYPS